MRKESGIAVSPDRKETHLFDMVGDKNKVRAKLQKGFIIAFLASNEFRISIANNNDHLVAAKAIGLPSNNSNRILCKGRIIPQLKIITLHNSDLAGDALYNHRVNQENNESLNSQVAQCLREWLGQGFEDYKTQFRTKATAA